MPLAPSSARFGIPTSIKTTSIKPSGTVSLLAGATPGALEWVYPRNLGVAKVHTRRSRVSSVVAGVIIRTNAFASVCVSSH